MKPTLRTLICRLALFGAVLASTSICRAETVTVHIHPTGLNTDSISDITPEIEPISILDPAMQTSFDSATQAWMLTTRALVEYLTAISINFKQQGRLLHAAIVLEVPRRERLIRFSLPLAAENSRDRVLSYYRDGIADTVDERLDAFLSSDHVIDYLQGNGTADQIPVSIILARALTVYAEAVGTLVANTEWFGRPSSLRDRMNMIQRLKVQASANLLASINMARLAGGERLLRDTEVHLIRRAWKFSVLQEPYCIYRFALTKALYRYLNALPEDEYKAIVSGTQLTRSEALLGTVECFRQLISIDRDSRFARPEVVSVAFRDTPAVAERAELERALRQSIEEVGGTSASSCRSLDHHSLQSRLCRDLHYLEELRPNLR